jgi:hypothetical protein
VVFREVGGKSEPKEVVQTKNNLDRMCFELRNEEDDSHELKESDKEVEQLTLMIRRLERERKLVERYSSSEFPSTFMLTSIDDKPKLFGEEVDSIDGKIWKNSIVENMESLYKNEIWDLVKLPIGINIIGSK